MKRRCVAFILVLAMVLSVMAGTAWAEQDQENHSESISYEPVNFNAIDFTNMDNEAGYFDIAYGNTGFVWNDVWLTEENSTFNPDLAKAAVALSVLAYDKDGVSHVLTASPNSNSSLDNVGMGFTLVDDGSSYGSRSFTDNDHVAYRIARKKYTKDGEDYLLYCVPVRGTSGAEWFSDFCNLGTRPDGIHNGFYLAACELMEDLRSVFYADGSDPAHRAVLLTGHSRGAAVSNIVSAWLLREGVVSSDTLYSYNFACPNVSKSVTKDPCIFNIINKGDAVPTMPLRAWGYKRNGVDKEFNITAESEIYSQLVQENPDFATVSGHAGFESLMTALLPNESEYFKPLPQLAFLQIAYCLGGWEGMDAENGLLFQARVVSLLNASHDEKVSKRLSTATGYFRRAVLDLIDYHQETLRLVDDFFASLTDLLEDENPLGRLSSTLRSRLEELWTSGITCLADITGARGLVEQAEAQAIEVSNVTGAIMQLFEDTDGNFGAIGTAHDQRTYYRWACIRYLGYKGYFGNTEKASATTYLTGNEAITTIGPCCFQGCTALTDVTFSPSVRHIAYYSFENSGISGPLVLPEGLLSVGRNAFDDCFGLTAIRLPHTLRWIGYNAFVSPNVTEVWIPVELPAVQSFYVPNVETIHYLCGSTGVMPDRRAYNGTALPGLDISWTLENSCIVNLSAVDFEEGIVHIGNKAFDAVFQQNSVEGALTDVTLPSTLESIGASAFSQQVHLSEIELPQSLLALGDSCFEGTGLVSVVIPEKVEVIPEYCFSGCAQLASVELPEGLTAVSSRAFSECAALQVLHLPHTVVSLGDYAFYGTSSLKELSIPVELCDTALILPFNYVGSIETIHYLRGSTGVMPDKARIEGLEQSLSASLKEVDFEEGITRIGDNAFVLWGSYGTGSDPGVLEKVTLPSTLKSVGVSAFHGRAGVSALSLPEGLETLGDYAFAWDAFTVIDIPSTVTAVGASCFEQCDNLALIRFHGSAPLFANDSVFRYDVAELTWPSGKSGWDASVDALSLPSLFCHADGDPVLTVPGHVRVLEDSALQNVGVSLFELSPGIESIGPDAFSSDDRDLLIHVPSSVTRVGENAFRSGKRVFIVAPENSAAWIYARNHSQNGSLYLITAPD